MRMEIIPTQGGRQGESRVNRTCRGDIAKTIREYSPIWVDVGEGNVRQNKAGGLRRGQKMQTALEAHVIILIFVLEVMEHH